MKRFVLLLVMAFLYICGFAQTTPDVDVSNSAEASQSLWIISPFIILPLCLLILAVVSFKVGNLTGNLHRLNWGIYVALCFLQIVYPYLYFTHSIALPESPLVILSVPFTAVVQVVSTFVLIDDFQKDCKAKFNLWIGIGSIIGFILYVLIVSFFKIDVETYHCIALCLVVLCQIIQSAIIYKEARKTKGVSYVLLMILTYWIGSVMVLSSVLIIFSIVLPFLLIYWYIKYKPKETEEEYRKRKEEEFQKRMDAAYYDSLNY